MDLLSLPSPQKSYPEGDHKHVHHFPLLTPYREHHRKAMLLTDKQIIDKNTDVDRQTNNDVDRRKIIDTNNYADREITIGTNANVDRSNSIHK